MLDVRFTCGVVDGRETLGHHSRHDDIGRAGPVSYTHLDVYKRQGLIRENNGSLVISKDQLDQEFQNYLATLEDIPTTILRVCTMTSSAVVTEMSGRNNRRFDRCISTNTGATLLAVPTTV